MNQVEVEIMGRGYILVCPEGGEERLRDAVRRVDHAMCRIRDAGKVRARDRIAVLAAVNLAFELGQSATPEAAPAPEAAPGQPKAPAAANEAAAQNGDQKDLEFLLERLDKTLEEK
ncbi:MAG: cell division protein ZapA [Burkholderiaceae bacterium]|jgi:cell division protein ZapA|nr:MAG: cell division protein ZapA [Burkholderiaceae bacterium]